MLGLDDVVFHLAITPDRGHCMSVRLGPRARVRLATLTSSTPPATRGCRLPIEGPAWPLTVQPETGVRRFALRPVIGPTPPRYRPGGCSADCCLRYWRDLSGGRRDHYVMLELATPMHAHDRNRSAEPRVRFARSGETARLLDGIERKFDTADVPIVDDAAISGDRRGGGRPAPKCGPTPPMSCWRPRYGTRLRYRVPSGGCTCLARPPCRYERTEGPSPWPLWTGAQHTADIAGEVSPTYRLAVTCRVMTGHRRRPDGVDVPDRIAGVAYPAGHYCQALAQIGAVVTHDGDT